jgi:hypothetical protein
VDPAVDLFRFVRVDLAGDRRIAADARPPRVEPMSGPPDDFGPRKYDDVDYYVGAAHEAGQRHENAFAHIGFYLAWLIRHDMHDQRAFPTEHVRALKQGEMTGSDLADDCDGTLVSDLMTDEGIAFSDARYESYVAEYERLFSDAEAFTVVDDAATYALVAPVIDRLYADWVASGRPAPDRDQESMLEKEHRAPRDFEAIPWEELAATADAPVAVDLHGDGSYTVLRPPEPPHEALELEVLFPSDLFEPYMSSRRTLPSGTPRSWTAPSGGSACPERTYSWRPSWGDRETGRSWSCCTAFPGSRPTAWSEEFKMVISREPGSRWKVREVEGHTVTWADGVEFTTVFWARDGLLIHVAGAESDVRAAVRRMA